MITISFDFGHFREESDLEQINALLDTMRLQDLCLENENGYLCTTRDKAGNILSRRYGLDEGTLRCKLAREAQGYHYRIDTFTEKPTKDHEKRIDKWRAAHSDRIIRYAMVVGFENLEGYVLIHHNRVNIRE